MAIRAGQVVGHRLTSCGNGTSIRPATGSATGWGSAKMRPRRNVAAAATVTYRHRAQQLAELRCGLLGGAEGQHGHAEFTCPGEYALQPFVRCALDALAHAVAPDLQLDLQLAVGDRHACRRGK